MGQQQVKVTQELKNIQVEQMTKLQAKHQAECDLLEDMRTFSQKKAAIEREYAQGIQKLASQYLKRDWPGIKADDRNDYRSMYPVWKSFLEGTMQVAQSRINICENYKNFISEPARTVKSLKEQQLKRCVDQLTKIQTELQETVKDLAKGKKKYFETEQMAHAVREKADIEAKSKLSLFQSRISLQKASVKLKARRSECNSKATHARNDYLLTLAAANAHQDRYYQTDLVNIMKALDGNVYDHLKDYLIAFSRTELETCQAVQNTFQFLLETSSKVVRDYNLQLFLQENAVFHKPQPFQFQPCDSDTSRQLESETGTTEEHSLNKEARKWATRVAREHKNIVHQQRVLDDLECHGVAVSEQGRTELEQKIDEARENIRKAEIIKLKAEARLDLLKQIGVSVDTWLKSAMNQVMEELENERWARLPAVTNNGTLHSLNADTEREEGEEFEDNMDVFDDSSSSPSGTLRNYPLTCKVVYSYKASQPDELTIEEHEVLEVIEDGDMEDWVKVYSFAHIAPSCDIFRSLFWFLLYPVQIVCANLFCHMSFTQARNKVGQVGYVPEKYLQFPTSNSLLSMLQSLAALDSRSHTSSNSTEAELVSGSLNGDASVCFVKALYDYEGQTDDELSFPEGAIIRILNKENQDDDGFWEGEFNGRIGVFPSVLVEELSASENGDTPWMREIQISPSPKLPGSLPPLPLYDQPPSSPYPSPDKRSSQYFPRSPSANENSFHAESPGFSQASRHTPETSYGKLRPVRAAPPPPTQNHRRPAEKIEDVEITLV
ncbi:F-BAR and double SH3 domains protein 2 isoform X2 [Neophocaena asiaeorientalis asiaeorientalis]|uniref:F-BAR and double SH3 domains protein 2 n=1 Tax=Neophocaena asiaeorientalis asiaeorientalis TaxID=1706337 RepID=A0A341C2K9_NEOAA|nr:F-BAR and double SH3 domains protein 2 isoform X2 [Neophocaena asiaeorientalis asiaeorientalis]